MIHRVNTSRHSLRFTAVLIAACGALGACTHANSDDLNTASIPRDYRQRHPIVVQEADRTVEVFVGTGRGGLTSAQRGDIVGLAQTWLREGTGGITIDMPANTPNSRVATDSLRDIQGLLAATGVPPRGIKIRNYTPADPRQFATIRVKYPRIIADAGPCGLWPEDLGPSVKNKSYLENRPYQNFGCASQRNLAAMVDNPADLVQPRSESPAYTSRRNVAFNRYRKGEAISTPYPETDKAKLSELGK